MRRTIFTILTFFLVLIASGCASVKQQTSSQNDLRTHYIRYKRILKEGRSALERGDFSGTIDLYNRAIHISPFSAESYYVRGYAHYKSGNFIQAIEDFGNSILLKPGVADAYMYRGLSKMEREDKNYDQIFGDYKTALRLEQRNPVMHNNIALFYVAEGNDTYRNNKKACLHARKAVTLSKEKNAEMLETLAHVLFLSGEAAEAVVYIKKALLIDPDNRTYKSKRDHYSEFLEKQ